MIVWRAASSRAAWLRASSSSCAAARSNKAASIDPAPTDGFSTCRPVATASVGASIGCGSLPSSNTPLPAEKPISLFSRMLLLPRMVQFLGLT